MLVVLQVGLLALGPCATIAIESVIDGFFDAVNPVVIDYAADRFGVAPAP